MRPRLRAPPAQRAEAASALDHAARERYECWRFALTATTRGADNSGAMEFFLEPTVPGAALAALAVAGGGPLFSAGLRALRLRHGVSRLRERLG